MTESETAFQIMEQEIRTNNEKYTELRHKWIWFTQTGYCQSARLYLKSIMTHEQRLAVFGRDA